MKTQLSLNSKIFTVSRTNFRRHVKLSSFSLLVIPVFRLNTYHSGKLSVNFRIQSKRGEILNLFQANVAFLYALKRSGNQKLSDVFTGNRKRAFIGCGVGQGPYGLLSLWVKSFYIQSKYRKTKSRKNSLLRIF